MSTTIRVSEETRQRAADLARATGTQLQVVVEEALIAYERDRFWEQFESGYARLADDPDDWESVQAERQVEEPALGDGMASSER